MAHSKKKKKKKKVSVTVALKEAKWIEIHQLRSFQVTKEELRFQKMVEMNSDKNLPAFPNPFSILLPEFSFWKKHQTVLFLHFKTSGHYSIHKVQTPKHRLKGCSSNIKLIPKMFQSPETFSLPFTWQASNLEVLDPLIAVKNAVKVFVLWISQNVLLSMINPHKLI